MKYKLFALIFLCVFYLVTSEVRKGAMKSLSREVEQCYSGFYNRGYEVGYEDAKAGRERAQPIDFRFKDGAVTDAGKTD